MSFRTSSEGRLPNSRLREGENSFWLLMEMDIAFIVIIVKANRMKHNYRGASFRHFHRNFLHQHLVHNCLVHRLFSRLDRSNRVTGLPVYFVFLLPGYCILDSQPYSSFNRSNTEMFVSPMVIMNACVCVVVVVVVGVGVGGIILQE